MKKWIIISGIAGIVVGGLLMAAVLIVPRALAQGPAYGFGPGSGFNGGPGFGSRFQGGFGPGFGRGMGRGFGPGFAMGPRLGGPENSLIAVAAEQLGMTPQELLTELQSGKTMADVAAEKDVALETIVEAFITPRTERLQELVDNGQLTQEQADAQIELMRANVTARLNEAWSTRGPGYIDKDGDGVCDHAGSFGRRGGPGGRWR
jgi:hypothetical protein